MRIDEEGVIMKKRSLLALGLSALLMFSNIITVYAEENTSGTETTAEENANAAVNGGESANSSTKVGLAGSGDTITSVTGNVSVEGKNSKGTEATGNADIRVNGDVSAKGDNSIGVCGADHSTTTVTGTVSAEGTGSYGINVIGSGVAGTQSKDAAVSAGSVTVKGSGSTGIYADTHAKVTVENGVKVLEGTTDNPGNGGYINPVTGVIASRNANVTVKGNVETEGKGSSGVTVLKSGHIVVDGDISASGEKYVFGTGNEQEVTGINATGGIVTVKGNVTSSGTGILIQKTGDMINSDVEVKGDVSGSSGIVINKNSNVTVGGTVTATEGIGLTVLLEDSNGQGKVTLGSLNVGKEGQTGIILDVKNMRYLQSVDDIINAMPEINVFEINVNQGAYLGIDAGTEDTTNLETGIFQKEAIDQILQQKIKYMLRTENTSDATISLDQDRAAENAKVTFYVKAADGYRVKGVSAGKTEVIDNGDGSYTIIVPRGGGVNISAVMEAVIREQQRVQDSRSNTGSSDATVIPEPAQQESAWQQIQQMQQQIRNTAQGGSCEIRSDGLICFNRTTFEALMARPDVSLTIIFKWKGVKYKVTIPAGYPVLDLLNEDGYCGCLYLNAVFGSEIIG